MEDLPAIIKYLKAYQHYCYLQTRRQPCKATVEHYDETFKDVGRIIKNLENCPPK